jgi:hypothetical protein
MLDDLRSGVVRLWGCTCSRPDLATAADNSRVESRDTKLTVFVSMQHALEMM